MRRRRPRSLSRAAGTAVLMLLMLSLTLLCVPSPRALGQGESASAVRPLPTEKSAEYETGGGERHPYAGALAAGEFLQVRVEQSGVDVALSLTDATGRELAWMDSPNGNSGPETLSFVAKDAGAYTLNVVADAQTARGRYAIRRTAARPATAADARRVEVERSFAEGMKARAVAEQVETAVARFAEALAGWQELSDAEMAAMTRPLLAHARGRITFREGRKLSNMNVPEESRKAIDKFIEAARLFHEGGDRHAEGAAYFGAAVNAEFIAGTPPSVVAAAAIAQLYQQAARLFSQFDDKALTVKLLDKVAGYSALTGDLNSALQAQRQALPLYGELNMRAEEAAAENDIGALYSQFGEYDNALKHLKSALAKRQPLRDKCGTPATLTNLGYVYAAMGQKAQALDYLERQAWPLYRVEGDCAKGIEYPAGGDCAADRAATLINIGKVYYDLGDNNSAQCFYRAAEKLTAEESHHAARFNNSGAAYYAAGRYREALGAYERALALYERLKDTKNIATTRTNLGAVRAALGEHGPALRLLEETLTLRRDALDRVGEAITLNGIGEIHLQSGDHRAALEYISRALPLFAAAGDRNLEASALGNAMRGWRSLGNRKVAIFYGKQAVNRYQRLRGASRDLKGELQKNYLRTVKNAYQHLAELLIEEGLYEQAVQVLNFYQDQQFFDLSTGPRQPPQRIEFSQREKRFADDYEAAGARLAEVESRLGGLERRVRILPPTEEEGAELERLRAQSAEASAALGGVLKDAAAELSRPSGATEKSAAVDEISEVLKALRTLDSAAGRKTAALYTLVGDEWLYVLLLGPEGIRAFSRPVGAGYVGRKAEAFLAALKCPRLDPRPAGSELYEAIFKATATDGDMRATLAEALAGRKPDVLLWSLDGPLRGIPVAALYDAKGSQYLVEKYRSAVFTRAGAKRFLYEPRRWTKGIGLGTSKAKTGWRPLPRVPGELAAVFREAGAGLRPVEGTVLLDDGFTRKALNSLNGQWPLVHIASHFTFVPGDSFGSALLLGDGDQYRLFEMQEKLDLFAGVDLLMLSACETAVQQTDAHRKEIDGFAELAQRQGANSVIATLWPIEDDVAPALVVGFYRLHAAHPDWAKSELLRQAQLSLLRGDAAVGRETRRRVLAAGADDCAAGAKGVARFAPNPKAPLAHPFYWAPFALYGGAQ